LASRQIAFRIPSIYALLEAKGLDSQTTARALQLVASTYGPPELLTPGKYTVIISEEPELPVWGMYTNQEMINAFWVAGNKTWHLLNKAGLDLGALAADRQGAYSGPTTEDMDNLTAQEKAWIKAALPNKVPPPIRGPRAPASVSVTWQPAAPANYTGGRQGHALDMIILHATRRGLVAALEAAQRPIGGSSPHYIVGKDGAIYQLVRDEDTAHHATLAATQPQRDIRVRPNVRSLGVALENWGQAPNEFGEMEWDPYTAEQYESLQRLIRALCKIHDIPLKFPQAGPAGYAPTPELAYFRGLIGYSALDPGQPSPGPAFDWSLLGSESE
jgi:N-acetylmuramoyl-L-alanine amidase